MKPCETPCPKCGTTDIHRMHYDPMEGQVRERMRAVDNALVEARPVCYLTSLTEVVVHKECLHHYCRVCAYDWWSATMDSAAAEIDKQTKEYGVCRTRS